MEWILDLGCSFHMTPNKEWFETYNDQEGGSIPLGNTKSCKVTRIGTIKLELMMELKEYSKMLGMCQNLKALISVSTMCVGSLIE